MASEFVTPTRWFYVSVERIAPSMWRLYRLSNYNGKVRPVAKTEEKNVLPVKAIKEVETMSFEDYQKWLQEEGVGVQEFEGGSEWELVDKKTLVDVPFVIARIRFNDGDYGNFTSVCAFLKDGKKVVFNDGSTGIKQQLETAIAKNGRETGILCPKGLRASHYKYTDEKGEEKPATTYYIQ